MGNLRLKGKTALITGGARGIGRAISELFSSEGANIAINYNSSVENAHILKSKLKNSDIFKADVSEREEVKSMITDVSERFGSIDILVNNAGIMDLMSFEDYDEGRVDRMLKINVKGPIYMILESLNYLRKSSSPVIINIASNAGIGTSLRNTTYYSITKAMIIMLTKRLAFDLSDYGIRVNAIAPGWVETDLTTQGRTGEEIEAAINYFKDRTTRHMTGSPSDVAQLALYLACDDSAYVNGQVVVIDGGRTDNLTHSL